MTIRSLNAEPMTPNDRKALQEAESDRLRAWIKNRKEMAFDYAKHLSQMRPLDLVAHGYGGKTPQEAAGASIQRVVIEIERKLREHEAKWRDG